MPNTPEVPPEPASRPGRPRQADLDQRLDAAVLALLREGGPAAVTVEGVAAKAGVAKTSIYRRHANRGELLTAVLENAIGVPAVPAGGTVREKLRVALEQAWRQMADILGPGGLAAIVGDSDPEFTELFRAALRPYDQALVARIHDDVHAGLMRPGVDADGVVSLLFGAYLGELVRRGHVAPDWLDRSLEMIWAVMVRPTVNHSDLEPPRQPRP
jgi:AcrR family transcriptional regulator